MKLIFIPGLGYDQRIFKNLDLAGFTIEYLNWIEPLPSEKISAYAKRMIEQLQATEEDTTLIGHSLGGIVAQEIASIKKISKVILISSIKARKEMPFYFKIIQPLRLEKLFTKETCLKTVKYWGPTHAIQTTEEQELFKSMVGSQTNTYLQWALSALSTWQEPTIPNSTKLLQIHGTKDKTFPLRLVTNPDLVIDNGSHLLVYKQPSKISEWIVQQIKQ